MLEYDQLENLEEEDDREGGEEELTIPNHVTGQDICWALIIIIMVIIKYSLYKNIYKY